MAKSPITLEMYQQNDWSIDDCILYYRPEWTSWHIELTLDYILPAKSIETEDVIRLINEYFQNY